MRQSPDAFADLRDKIDDGDKAAWSKALDEGRKVFDRFHADMGKWAEKLGVDLDAEDLSDTLRRQERKLTDRLTQLYRDAGNHKKALDALHVRIIQAFKVLQDMVKHEADAAKVKERLALDIKEIAAALDTWADKIVAKVAPEPVDVAGGARVSKVSEVMKAQLDIDHGVTVSEIVDKEGVLAKAGVKVHDIVLKLNDKDITGRDGLRTQLTGLKPGDAFTLKILRDGKQQDLSGTR